MKKFEQVNLELITFCSADVITTSGFDTDGTYALSNGGLNWNHSSDLDS